MQREKPFIIAWKMFEKTGNPAYYLIYKNLKEEK